MPAASPTTVTPLWIRAFLTMLLALGVVAISLCHPHAASSDDSVASPTAVGHAAEHVADSPDAAHTHEHDSCGESAGVLSDQRVGSLSASALLGFGVFAFIGPFLPSPRPVAGHRAPRHHRALPLGGTRALVSLCVRRV
ncbi:hypothetical protein ACFWTE_22780 [Nocardiopsis sp. NPDC058631]|uniref:hypothetical protein n=1 Tax=Nocardiopsis sp. NPDC058631 TaxID=3346566 RepID=UPI003663D342